MARMKRDSGETYTFGYLDESATSQCRYFGCGLLIHGPCVSGMKDRGLNQCYREWQQEHGFSLNADIGWKKVPTKPGKYLSYYLALVDAFFSNPQLSFHALVVDTQHYPLDSDRFFKGSADRGIDSFAYHLIRARAIRFPQGSKQLYFRFDRRQRPAGQALRTLGSRVREAADELAAKSGERISVRMRSIDGPRHPLIFIADILLGAVTADLNGKTYSAGKLEVTENPASPRSGSRGSNVS